MEIKRGRTTSLKGGFFQVEEGGSDKKERKEENGQEVKERERKRRRKNLVFSTSGKFSILLHFSGNCYKNYVVHFWIFVSLLCSHAPCN